MLSNKIAHIINPVVVKENSDLFIAQPITFETMKVAQKFAHNYGIDVKLYSAQFPEDHCLIPNEFTKTQDLERSILDLGNFQIQRKLPLIKDILDRLSFVSDAEYFIYSNVDIAVMPNFYVTISQIIKQGYDAFVINRRTISKNYTMIEDIPLMYAEAGQKHPGHDCFIFKKNAYNNYQLNSLCIGASLIGRSLLINLICNAQKFKEFKNLHLTFHIGDDRSWRENKFEDYTHHNLEETKKIIQYYKNLGKSLDHPLIVQFANNINPEFWLEKAVTPKNEKQKLTLWLRQKLKSLVNEFFF